MLPQTNRLRQEKDMKTLFAKGRSVFGTLVGMKLCANGRPVTRFAVVVGVKTAKRAVDRNRIKRRVRAIVYALLPELKGGFDVALLPRKEALTAKPEALKAALLGSLKKARLL
ncbi:ribonuclease P protein component [Candidatus Uhrbacteria bacterium]|nr:ribonuclease P protein component [Candidatus Uhrbacteria bacterium]